MTEASGEASLAREPWIADADVGVVLAALAAEGGTPRFVGGCVRNALLGAPVSDLDVAFDRPPQETVRLLRRADVKAVPTGIEHGTITALTPTDRTPIEVTSLRRDVATDGRRAVVAFTEDWAEDAARRDFTINALYADADGAVIDPLGGGLADLAERRVRFIGRAADRIREDALRILRFYRFAAWYGVEHASDPQDLADIAELAPLIGTLARERIGQELKKLLAAEDPAAALVLMAQAGALAQTVAPLPPPDPAPAAALVALERAAGLRPDPLRRLALLLGPLAPMKTVVDRFRLSRSEQRVVDATLSAWADLSGSGPAAGPDAIGRGDAAGPHAIGRRYGADAARDAVLLAASLDGETSPPHARLEAAALGAAAMFPLAAADLIAAGVPPGPQIGRTLQALEDAWIRSGFQLDKDALLASVSPAEPDR